MDKLIALEEAAHSAAHSAAGKRVAKPAKAARPAKSKPSHAASSADARGWDGVVVKGDDSEDEVDEDLEDNGSFVPDGVSDPPTAADAGAGVGRRVFLDGMQARRDLNGAAATVVAWHADAKRWEVEMDRRDERVLVRSGVMRYLDQPQRKAAKAKPKAEAERPKAGKAIKKKRKAGR